MATSLWQSPAMTAGQVEEEAGLDRGRWGKLLTWLWVHPLLFLFPPSPSKSNPTGLGAEISYHQSLCRVIPAAMKMLACAHYIQLCTPAYPSPIYKAPSFTPEWALAPQRLAGTAVTRRGPGNQGFYACKGTAAGEMNGCCLQRAPSPRTGAEMGVLHASRGSQIPTKLHPSKKPKRHPGLRHQPQLTTSGATLTQPSHVSPVPKDPSPTCLSPFRQESTACPGLCTPDRLKQEHQERVKS